MPTTRSLRLTFLVVCALFHSTAATAQETTPRVEVGTDVAESDYTFFAGSLASSTGYGVWFDVNLSPRLAIKTRATLFPGTDTRVQLSAGVRATLVRGRRVSMYGFVLPGMYHDPAATRVALLMVGTLSGSTIVLSGTNVPPAPLTHFVLDMGAGFEVFPTSRLSARLELDRDLHAFPALPKQAFGSDLPMYILNQWTLRAGAAYRFGRPVAAAPSASSRTWTMGPQLGVTVVTNAQPIGTVGMFASRRLGRFVDFDAGISGFISDRLAPSYYEGGRVSQALAGIKLGVREGRFGVYFKARSGVNSYSRATTRLLQPQFKRLTVPVLDIGGVIEADISRRFVLRVDAGETLSLSPGGVIPPLDPERAPPIPETYPAEQIYGLPIRFGIGWRF